MLRNGWIWENARIGLAMLALWWLVRWVMEWWA
jgi:hypothetical protein